MAAEHHWLALDRAFGRILSASETARARPRLGQRARALSNIYLPRLLDAQRCERDEDDSTRRFAELRQVHRRLSAALAAVWGQDSGPFTP